MMDLMSRRSLEIEHAHPSFRKPKLSFPAESTLQWYILVFQRTCIIIYKKLHAAVQYYTELVRLCNSTGTYCLVPLWKEGAVKFEKNIEALSTTSLVKAPKAVN